jgi:hypothetical protein
MPGWYPQRRGTARTLPNFCVALCILCVVLCTFVLFYVLFVCICVPIQLPPGGYPIAVKYIISYHIYHINRQTR